MPWCSGSFGGAFLRYPFGVDYSRTEGAVGVVFSCGSADYCGGDGGCDQFGSFGGVHGVTSGGALTVLLFPLWALGIRQAFGSGQPVQQEPSRKEQMNALKAQRNAQTKLTTGMIPVVRLKSQSDAETPSDAEAPADAQPGSAKTTSSAKTAGSAEK